MIVNTITILPAMTTKRSRGANYLGPRDGVITTKVEGSATLTSKRERDEAFKNVMDNVFGNGVSVTRHMGAGNLDLKESGAHTTTGIPYSTYGSAHLVEMGVAKTLLGYQDPIKLILGMGIHEAAEVVIRRKFVVGGQAIITPERAPARTVAIKEDERRVVLARYGGDLEMNKNLALRPNNEFEDEFRMKLGAQIEMLAETHIQLAYEEVMKCGIQLQEALLRANPTSAHMSKVDRQALVDHTYVHSVFGAMNKSKYPMYTLMNAAKQASIYTPGVAGGYSVMIVPVAMLDHQRFETDEKMVYSVSGMKANDGKPIDLKLDNVQYDPATNMRIMVHAPRPSIARGGMAYPQVEQSGLAQEVVIFVIYRTAAGDRIPDHKTRSWRTTEDDQAKTKLNGSYVVAIKLMMSSAIVAVPGADTGEMLLAYPSTSIGDAATVEAMKMQLRVYLGAAVYDRNKILILPDVHCEGIISVSNPVKLDGNDDNGSGGYVMWKKDDIPENIENGLTDYLTGDEECITAYPGRVDEPVKDKDGTPCGGWRTKHENMGHLGKMDDPNNPSIYGMFGYRD